MAKADDFLNLLAVLLESKGVVSVKTGVQPDAPANCTTLVGIQGNTIQQNRDVAGFEFPRFQAIIRNESYEDAALQFRLTRQTLHGMIGKILPEGVVIGDDPKVPDNPYVRVLRCHADQEGGPIGDDDKGRYEFTINFTSEIHYVDSPDDDDD